MVFNWLEARVKKVCPF